MAKTVQHIVDRAGEQELALDGDLFFQEEAEVLSFLNDWLHRVYKALARFTRFYYSESTDITSSDASSARTVDLTNVGAGEELMEAIRRLELPSGSQIFLVDEDRQGEQPAPRGYLRGTTLHEVGSEWSATSGTVDVTVLYTRQPQPLDEAGAFSQTVDLPETWTRPLVDALTAYAVRKDNRDATMWFQTAEAGIAELAQHLEQLHGVPEAVT